MVVLLVRKCTGMCQVSPTGNLPPPPRADNGAGLSSTLGKYYKAADLGRPVRGEEEVNLYPIWKGTIGHILGIQ